MGDLPSPLWFGMHPSSPPFVLTPVVCLGMGNPTPGPLCVSGTLLWREPLGHPPKVLGGQPLCATASCGCEFSCHSLLLAHSWPSGSGSNPSQSRSE